LAGERDYYGFLAADRVGQVYRFGHDAVPFTETDLAAAEALPGIARARELLRVGLTIDARREWRDAIRDLDDRQLEIAAVLAGRWGWHDRAIVTVARADHFDDLDLRFPLVYQDLVLSNARATGLDPAWVYGVMRQESAFWEDARSRSGALGLMQLMPSTARETARRLRERVDDVYDLLSPPKNIRLGVAYLRRVLDRFDGHQGLATAAYNAGPGRVRSWLPGSHPLAADIWVDTVPFNETRGYVKRVMAYTAIYEHRLERPVRPLKGRLPPVPATIASLTDGGQVATIRFPEPDGKSRG
jgi:soluble lytic murein transglycosylase